jgi:hypothetical protein
MNNLGVTSHHPGLADGPIYLDYNATTPVDPRVAETTQPYLTTHFGNPSSGHAYCRTAPPRAGRGPPTTDRCTRQSQTEVHSDLADSRISLPWTSTHSAIGEMSGSYYELLTFKRAGQLRARTG